MPKVVYTGTKGLVQETGSGVFFSGQTVQGALRKVRTVVAADSSAGITFTPADSGVIISIKVSNWWRCNCFTKLQHLLEQVGIAIFAMQLIHLAEM